MSSKVIPQDEWKKVQEIELSTWSPTGWTDPGTRKEYKPYPSFEGKLEREREYQRTLLRLFRISGIAGTVADIGCGPTPILEQAEGNFVGIGVDPLIPGYAKHHAIWEWKKTIPLACCAEEIRLPSATIHHVISTNALDHFANPYQAFGEMMRILKPGGTIWLSVCINNASEGHVHPAHHIDLDQDDIMEWSKDKLMVERLEIVEYGWRKQAAILFVARKNGTKE